MANGSGDASDRSTDRTNPHDPLSVDLANVVIPDDKPYDEFSVDERRAVLLDRVVQAGHPREVPQTYRELGDEFGVHKSMIHKDMEVISEWIAEHTARDHVSIMDAVFHRAVRELVSDGEWVEAAEVGSSWFEWLADMGSIERVADKLDLNTTGDASTEDYEVLDEDELAAIVAGERDVTGLLEHGDGTVTDPDSLQAGESEPDHPRGEDEGGASGE